MSKTEKVVLVTPVFIAVFPCLAEARKPEGFPNATAKFSLTMAFTSEDFVVVGKAITQALVAKFGAQAATTVRDVLGGKLSALKAPLETGSAFNAKRVAKGKTDFEELEDKILVKSSSAFDVQVVNGNLDTIGGGEVRGGDLCRAEVTLAAMEGPLYHGVVVYLSSVQRVKRGTGGGRPASEVFTRIEDVSNMDPFTAVDDEVPY